MARLALKVLRLMDSRWSAAFATTDTNPETETPRVEWH
jgi:hypothetical protein